MLLEVTHPGAGPQGMQGGPPHTLWGSHGLLNIGLEIANKYEYATIEPNTSSWPSGKPLALEFQGRMFKSWHGHVLFFFLLLFFILHSFALAAMYNTLF